MKTIKRLTLTIALALAALTGIATTASAAASPGAGTFAGNKCVNGTRTLQNYGAEVCYFVNSYSATSFNTSLGAYDGAADGYSAKGVISYQQYSPSTGWTQSGSTFTVINSSGRGYTKVSTPITVNRRSGATHYRIVLTACTYNAPTSANISCATSTYSGAW